MKYELGTSGSFPLVYIKLDKNEEIRIENGSMAYHNGNVSLEGKMNSGGGTGLGGALRAVGRSMTSGESFFVTKARGLADNSLIALAPSNYGQIKEIHVGQINWCLNSGSFVAGDDTVDFKMVRQSIGKAVFAGTGGLLIMETSGQGVMLISGYGDLVEVELNGSSNFVIDNNHVVAWQSSLKYTVKAGSGKFGFTSGEGLVNEFSGIGKVIIQTRNLQSFAQQIIPFIPKSN